MIARHLIAAAIAAVSLLAPVSVQAQDLAAQQREDLEFLRTEYLPRERALTPETRANAERIIDELLTRAGSMTPQQFFLGFSRVNAAADNGHSAASYRHPGTAPTTRLPFIVAQFDDAGLVILRALPPHQDLAGATILAIEGRPAIEVFDALKQYFGGTNERRALMAPRLIQGGGMLMAAGFASSAEQVSMRFRLRDGSEVERDVDYVPNAQIGAGVYWSSRWWSPEPINGDTTTPWTTAISAEGLPLYLQNGDAFNRALHLPELDAVYLELKSNEADEDAREFEDRAEAVLRQAHATNLIVDFRFSYGGDMRTTATYLERLPSRIPANGRIFVIVGRYSFSAGMSSAAILINASGGRAVVVGETPGDRMRHWSEGDHLCAPNSRFCVRYTDGYYDQVDGCRGEPRCRGENNRFNLVASLAPTLQAPTTWADYLAKRDPAMNAIRAALNR